MESKTVLNEHSEGNLRLPTVIVRKELHSLIGTVKKMQLVTTYEEVLEGLKIYIWEKKLYDPHNPFKVCCKDDELGSVLGAKEFTVFDVKTFLHKLVIPLSKTSKDSPEVTLQSVSDNSSKRKFDENYESEQKKMCASDAPVESSISENCESEEQKMCAANSPHQSMSPMILHIPPSPEKCNNSSDSSDSLQGYETAYVKDSTDEIHSIVDSDDFFSPGEQILAIEETYNLEYEVETDFSDDVQSSDSSLTDSEVDITAEVTLDAAILSFVCRTDSDIEFFADDSSDEDIEIPESDHWKCDKCNFSNRPPMRYCSRCWKERLEWLPESSLSGDITSPPKKRRKQRKSKNSLPSSSRETTEKDEASFSKSSQESQASSCSSEVSPEIKGSQELLPDSQSSGTSEPGHKLCIICCAKPANASIIHGKYAHQISCYKCARKLQKQKKRCPICRRTIDRVVHQISND